MRVDAGEDAGPHPDRPVEAGSRQLGCLLPAGMGGLGGRSAAGLRGCRTASLGVPRCRAGSSASAWRLCGSAQACAAGCLGRAWRVAGLRWRLRGPSAAGFGAALASAPASRRSAGLRPAAWSRRASPPARAAFAAAGGLCRAALGAGLRVDARFGGPPALGAGCTGFRAVEARARPALPRSRSGGDGLGPLSDRAGVAALRRDGRLLAPSSWRRGPAPRLLLGGLGGELGLARRVRPEPDADRLHRRRGARAPCGSRRDGAAREGQQVRAEKVRAVADRRRRHAALPSSSPGIGPRRSQITGRMFGGRLSAEAGSASSVGLKMPRLEMLEAVVEQLGGLEGALVGGGRAHHHGDRGGGRCGCAVATTLKPPRRR